MTDTANAGIAFVEGRYVPVAEARIPLLDWGFLRSDANQDTVTVWDGAFFPPRRPSGALRAQHREAAHDGSL